MCFIYLDKNYIILRDDFKQRLNFCKWGSYVLFLWLYFEWWRLSCFVTSPPAYIVCQINLLFFHTYLQLGWFAMLRLEHLECLQWFTVTCILMHTTYIELILFIIAYNMQEYGFSVSRVLPHKSPQNCQAHSNNSSGNSRRIVWVCLTILWVLMRENTGQSKLEFSHI